MAQHDQLNTALVTLASRLVDLDTVESVLVSMADLCVQLLPVTGAGVLLLQDGDLVIATTNSALGDRAEHLEADLGEGPCVDSIRTARIVAVPDLASDAGRWPRFGPAALEAGVGSMYGLPMTGRSELVGALDLVHDEPLELSDEQLSTAQVLADVAVSYILAVRLHEERGRVAEQLQRALDSRVVIEQAKGMLAERHDLDVRASFDLLRQHARSKQRTIRAVAAEVVDGSLRL